MKRIKVIIFMALLLVFGVSLSSCNLIIKDDNITLKQEEKSFINYSNEYTIKSDKLTFYYVDESVIPYVDISTFFYELDGLFDYQNMTFSKSSFLEQATITCNGLRINFNWNHEYISVDDELAFNVTKETIATDYSRYYKLENNYINKNYYIPTKFELSDLGYNFYYKENKVLVPFSLMNFLFCSQHYYNIHFTEDGTYGDYLFVYGKSPYVNEVYKSKYVGKVVTVEEREENYRLLKFIMKYYYGLGDKSEDLENYKDALLSTDPNVYSDAYYRFINLYLNELHSAIIRTPYTVDYSKVDKTKYVSEADKVATNTINALVAAKNKSKPDMDKLPILRFKDYMAVIHINEFVTGTNEKLYNPNGSVKEDAYLYDTYFLAKYAFEEIEKHPEITDVVIDLANNGGGNGAAMIKLLGFFTDEEIPYTSLNCINGRIISSTYKVDLKGDESYTRKSYAGKYNFYIQASEYSYSAANIFTATMVNMGLATLIGNKTGGGACAIIPILMPDGTEMQISGPTQMIILKNTETYEYETVEKGVAIDPNNIMPYDKYYDDDYLLGFITER